MKNLIMFAAISFALFSWYSSEYGSMNDRYGETHNELIMYSLTTCGYCKQKAKQLHARNIAFTEYFIDKDTTRRDELNDKLTGAGFKPKSYGTPIFDAHGVMMPNNPSMDKILDNLQDG